jgi:hypothetical protein
LQSEKFETALPWSNKWVLVTAIWIQAPEGIPDAVVMIWAANFSAGHMKKTTVIALYHVGYGLGNVLSPQLSEANYKTFVPIKHTINECSQTVATLFRLMGRHFWESRVSSLLFSSYILCITWSRRTDVAINLSHQENILVTREQWSLVMVRVMKWIRISLT